MITGYINGRNKVREMNIIKYRTARDCLAKFNGCKPSEIPLLGYWEFFDCDGKKIRMQNKISYKNILEIGCWGWCENKSILHLWISKRAKFIDAIRLIAHELGHCQPPFTRPGKLEEIKASRYEAVAMSAVEILELW